MGSNGQFRVEFRPGAVRLIIHREDDNTFRYIDANPDSAREIGVAIIEAAMVARMQPAEQTEASSGAPACDDPETSLQTAKILKLADWYAKNN